MHVGERKTGKVKITLLDYNKSSLEEKEVTRVEDCFPFKKRAISWVNIDGLHQSSIIEKLGSKLAIHPLVLEDIMNTDQRPKIEDYDEYLFIVLKIFSYDRNTDIAIEQVSLILGPTYVISFQEKKDIFDAIRKRLQNRKGRITKMGADFLAYSLIDTIVDQYFIILEQFGEKIEALEIELVENPSTETVHTIHNLKRELLFLRKSVWPLRELINALLRGESQLIHESTRIYLRDVYDHTIQVIDTVETYRDILSGMLDIYLSSVSNRMNEVMKVLTVIATIFIPLTFLAGIYGMNFRFMPELEWQWSYPILILIMIIIVVSMAWYFHRKRWL